MEKKREILEEQIKQALTSTFKVISNHIEDKNSKNKDLKIKTLDFSEIKDLKSKNDYIRLRANTDSKALKINSAHLGVWDECFKIRLLPEIIAGTIVFVAVIIG